VAAALAALAAVPAAQAAKLIDRDTVWNPPPVVVPPPGEVPPPVAELEARGATIGQIHIRVFDIFDPSLPAENNWLYRAANTVHIETRPETARARLTFKEGEVVSRVRLEESERALRGQRYLFDAIVRPVRYDPATNTVDIEVSIRDVWTLNPGISYGSQGGTNRKGIQLEELNLLGFGKQLQFSWSKDDERTEEEIDWSDPNVMGSRWRLDATYAKLSDGTSRALSTERPFYSLDARWAAGVAFRDDDRIVTRYSEGDDFDAFRADRRNSAIQYGWSKGLQDGWTERWFTGWKFSENRFFEEPGYTPPPDLLDKRELSYPFVGLQLVQDAFGKERNQDQISRTEDVYLGNAASASLGLASQEFGSTQDAVILGLRFDHGNAFAHGRRLAWRFEGNTRVESGGLANGMLTASAQHYWRSGDKYVFYTSLTGTLTENLDFENQLFLGADEGLRGYRIRYQSGTASAITTLEWRVYTDWFPFRLVNVGGAVFFDAGRTWGRDVAGAVPLGLLKDIGVGLRLGNSRSGLGSVLHIDFAYALDAQPGEDKFQINVQTKRSF
jgi:outer membrane protein assembly factor BamA